MSYYARALLLIALISLPIQGCVFGASDTSSSTTTSSLSDPKAIDDNPSTEEVVPESVNRTLGTDIVATGLDFPVKLDVAPDGTIFFTELRNGAIRMVDVSGVLQDEPFAEIDISLQAETGLIGIALHPDYPELPYVYVYATQSTRSGTVNRVLRLTDDEGRGTDLTVILDGIPSSPIHNGGEIGFGPDGKLYVTTGDARNPANSQNRSSLSGKVLRINADGSIPDDNPFASSRAYSLGHRNMVGLAFRPASGTVYITENGPDRNDEINRVLPGRNYGWPEATGIGSNPEFENPLTTYTPNIAPTGAAFISSSRVYGDNNNGLLLFGDHNLGRLHALTLSEDGAEVLADRIIFNSDDGVYDVTEAPDGTIYFTTRSSIRMVLALP